MKAFFASNDVVGFNLKKIKKKHLTSIISFSRARKSRSA